MVAWWQSLSLETLIRLNSLMVGFTALAALAVSVGGVLIWLSSNRMEQLKNEAELKAHAEQVITEADLRAQIKDAEVRAGAATQKAEEAHELANRQTPRALSGDLMSQAVALLRQWVARHRETSLNIVLVGVGEPSVDHVAAVVS